MQQSEVCRSSPPEEITEKLEDPHFHYDVIQKMAGEETTPRPQPTGPLKFSEADDDGWDDWVESHDMDVTTGTYSMERYTHSPYP